MVRIAYLHRRGLAPSGDVLTKRGCHGKAILEFTQPALNPTGRVTQQRLRCCLVL